MIYCEVSQNISVHTSAQNSKISSSQEIAKVTPSIRDPEKNNI